MIVFISHPKSVAGTPKLKKYAAIKRDGSATCVYMDRNMPEYWPTQPAYAAACRAIAASGMDRCTVVDAGCGPYAHACEVRGCLREIGVSCRAIGIDEIYSPPSRTDRALLRLLSWTMRNGRRVPEWRSRSYNLMRSPLRRLPVLCTWFERPFHMLCHDRTCPYDEFIHGKMQDADIGPVADVVILSYVTSPADPEFSSIFAAASAMCAPGGVVACSWVTDQDEARVLTADEAADHGKRCANTHDCLHGLAARRHGYGAHARLRRAAGHY